MKRIFLYALVISSGVVLVGCDVKTTVQKESIQPVQSTRSMSIVGMPVYEKDFRLQPLLADNTQIKQPQ